MFIADVEYREHKAIARFITIASALSMAVSLFAAGSTSVAAQAVVLSGEFEVGPTGAWCGQERRARLLVRRRGADRS